MKHKHCDLIKAWADGAKIEYLCPYLHLWKEVPCPAWHLWEEVPCPAWEPNTQYQIKKELVKKWKFAVECPNGDDWFVTMEHYTEEYVKQHLSKNYIKIPQTEIEVEV